MGILTRLRDIANLPTLPEIIAKLRVAISDGERGASEVANIVMQDPALSSMVLRVANSALYAGASSVRRIQDIRTAIMRIGFSEVMKISAVVCAIRQFPNTNSLIGYR